MDLNETMRVYKTGTVQRIIFSLRLIEILGKGTGMAEAWNQWTACPDTGDMVVSFATHDKMAFKTEPHYFNLYQLLQEQQP